MSVMSYPNQNSYPSISALGLKSPMVSPLPPDHPAWVHPVQSYIWMHDMYRACREILGIEMPEEQILRFTGLMSKRFWEDYSGRTTGKTHNYLAAIAIISICLSMHDSVFLGQDKEIGVKVFDKHYATWIEYCDIFRRFVTARGKHKPKVSHTQSGAGIRFHNGSLVEAISPDSRGKYKKMQSWRFNHGIFNEWDSWPYLHEVPDKVEPIFTNTNYHYRRTRIFRESMEKCMGVELGYMSNDALMGRHRRPDYLPRDYMEDIKPKPKKETIATFYRNFEIAFGFDYRYGVENEYLQFTPIRTENDLVMFFRNYDEGDPTYFNKLIYDGSAKKPSDDCYWLHKFFQKKVAAGSPLYGQYSIGIDDIPVNWDGIIYDSTVTEKAREEMLTEDFKRIYQGIWTEGRAKNPFSWLEIMAACKDGWYGQILRQNSVEVFEGAIDSAQGTDATFKTSEGIKDGRGDDGVVGIWLLGDGTSVKPHKLCYLYIAEDIRSEPMAFDIQSTEKRFDVDFYMADPGGGGKAVLEKLAKKHLEKITIEGEKEVMDAIPMLPWDHEDPGNSKTNICIFSLSNEMITATYRSSKTEKALLQHQDQLNNQMITLMQNGLRDGTVVFPQHLELNEIVDLYNKGEISYEQFCNMTDIYTGVSQLVHLRYVTDRQGKRVKTGSHQVYQYTTTGKKDAAWTILMGHMMCDIVLKIREMQEEAGKDKSIYPKLL